MMYKQLIASLILAFFSCFAVTAVHGQPKGRFKRDVDLEDENADEEVGSLLYSNKKNTQHVKGTETRTTSTTVEVCSKESFSCDFGKKCIPLKWLCDGVVDCEDSRDEHNCAKKRKYSNINDLSPTQIKEAQDALEEILGTKTDPSTDKPPKRKKSPARDSACPSGTYSCDGGSKCLLLSNLCDNIPDCDDEMDEHNCPSAGSTECPATKFRCDQDKKCIPLTWVCDRLSDCDDNRDESNCPSFPGEEKPMSQVAEEVAISAAQEAKRAAAAAKNLMHTAEMAAKKAQRAAELVEEIEHKKNE